MTLRRIGKFMHPITPSLPTRSNFVTVLAWILIVMAGFSTLIALLQNLMLNVLFPVEQLDELSRQARADAKMPAVFAFMLGHFRLFFAAILIGAATTLVAAIGLLKRKNWARLLLVAIMVLAVVWQIVGIVAQQYIFAEMPMMPADTPDAQAAAGFAKTFMVIIGIVSVVMGLAFAGLFAWIVKRLLSADIKREFV
jgi:hypothetical protein